MGYYERNKLAAITHNTDPTLTDQSQARETDINVIVSRYGISGQMPTNQNQGSYGDYTQLPEDFRDFIETSRTLRERWAELPPQLRGLALEEVMALTPEQLTNILAPPAKEPDEKKEAKE